MKFYDSGSPKYVTIFRVSKFVDSILGACQNCYSIFGGQQKNSDMNPSIEKLGVPPLGNFFTSPGILLYL